MWMSGNLCSKQFDRLSKFLYWHVKSPIRNFIYKLKDKRAAKMSIYRRETQQLHWLSLRSGVDSSDTILHTESPPTMKAANIPSHAYTVPPGMNSIELRLLCDADGRVATAHIYAARASDDICLVCSLAATGGKQQATDDRYYADTFTVTDLWMKDIETADINGGDRISRIAFDMLGYRQIFVLFDITSGTWGAEISGF